MDHRYNNNKQKTSGQPASHLLLIDDHVVFDDEDVGEEEEHPARHRQRMTRRLEAPIHLRDPPRGGLTLHCGRRGWVLVGVMQVRRNNSGTASRVMRCQLILRGCFESLILRKKSLRLTRILTSA